jgi:outer membrane protein, heavy metal efflux system
MRISLVLLLLSLPSLPSLADLGLGASRALVGEAEARAAAAGRRPDPEASGELVPGGGGDGRFELGIEQALPRGDRRRLERLAASEAVAVARLELTAAEESAVARARFALFDLAAAGERRDLARRHAAAAREFGVVERRNADRGQAAALDASQAELAVLEFALVLADLETEILSSRAALATALGAEPDRDLRAVVDLTLPETAPPLPAPRPRPDLALRDAAVTAADAEIALARAAVRGDLRLGLFLEGERRRDSAGARERDLLLGVRFGLPLPVRSAAPLAVAEPQARRRRLQLEREALAQGARRDVASAIEVVLSRHATALALAADLLPAARALVAAAEDSRARGEGDAGQVFRARDRLFQIERSDLAARHAYHAAVLHYLLVSGNLLP